MYSMYIFRVLGFHSMVTFPAGQEWEYTFTSQRGGGGGGGQALRLRCGRQDASPAPSTLSSTCRSLQTRERGLASDHLSIEVEQGRGRFRQYVRVRVPLS